MAAKPLQDVWTTQAAILNTSYVKTLDLLDAGKVDEASEAFHFTFVPAVKKLFTEAASAAPAQFKDVQGWDAWIKGLYVTTLKADKALIAANVTDAKPLLATVREQFYTLHNQANCLKANDIAYALQAEATQAAPDAAKLKALSAQLADAKSPAGCCGPAATSLTAAKTAFVTQVTPLLADGKLADAQLPALRTATQSLYQAVGRQLE